MLPLSKCAEGILSRVVTLHVGDLLLSIKEFILFNMNYDFVYSQTLWVMKTHQILFRV